MSENELYQDLPFITVANGEGFLLVDQPAGFACVRQAELDYKMVANGSTEAKIAIFPLKAFGELVFTTSTGDVIKRQVFDRANSNEVASHVEAPFVFFDKEKADQLLLIADLITPNNWSHIAVEGGFEIHYNGTDDAINSPKYFRRSLPVKMTDDSVTVTVFGRVADKKKKVIVNTYDGSVGDGPHS